MLPLVARTRPSRARPSVDLPEPDSPTRPSTSPGASDSETPSTARTVPEDRPTILARALARSAKWTFRSVISTSGAPAVSVAAPGSCSGFVGNGNLLPLQRRAVGVGQGRLEQPALRAVAG